jgi:hypothetical protein
MSITDIKLVLYGEATKVVVDIATINKFPDSISLVCGDIPDGNTKCGLERTPVILDSNNKEIDLSKSSIFDLNTTTGILTV